MVLYLVGFCMGSLIRIPNIDKNRTLHNSRWSEVKALQDKKEMPSGKKGTFLVNVQYCQNSTWQGYVVWAEKNKKKYFKSALEMMRLIDDALESAGTEYSEKHDLIEKKA